MAVNLLLRTVSGHRNIKISGDGLVALKLSMFFHNLFCQIYRQLFTLLSFLHAQCDTQTKGSSSIFLVHCIICAYRHLCCYAVMIYL